MLVCHCMVVNDRQIRAEIDRGAEDVFDVAQACEAGTVCGGCVPTICELLGQPSVADSISLPIRLAG